ncbi:MAG: GDSL-type esterase/lipase family protein [Cyanobacteria bacterium P01_D01_bin.105]
MASVVDWFKQNRLSIPSWAALSLVMNGLLFFTLLAVDHERSAKTERWRAEAQPLLAVEGETTRAAIAHTALTDNALTDNALTENALAGSTAALPKPELPRPHGSRKLTYEEHVAHLGDRAKAIAAKHPEHLTVLLGDSLSLWFPGELMPGRRAWINQSISGERTKGLLNRLELLEDNDIEAVFLMIGINDLIWGETDTDIIKNYRKIVRQLKTTHPKTQIVVQSILPHSGENSTWESRDKLMALSSDRIVAMNNTLKKIAKDNGTYYLDLYPIFVTGEGKLRPDLTTDGLHLNREGYLVWRSAIALYAQLELQQPPTISQAKPKPSTEAPSESSAKASTAPPITASATAANQPSKIN